MPKYKEFQCLHCGNMFMSDKACKSRVPKYCSRTCFSKTEKTDETREKQSIAKKGKEPPNKLPTFIEKCIVCKKEISNRKGAKYQKKYCSYKCYHNSLIGKIDYNRVGENSHFWKGGISKESEKARRNSLYKIWQREVFKRDNNICQKCGLTNKEILLHAHHILKFSENVENRYNVDNGITLCIKCHGDEHGLKFIDKNLTVCIDCGKKIKNGAKRCLNCLKLYRHSQKSIIHNCIICNVNIVKKENRKCKRCSAKLRENNFGRTKINHKQTC